MITIARRSASAFESTRILDSSSLGYHRPANLIRITLLSLVILLVQVHHHPVRSQFGNFFDHLFHQQDHGNSEHEAGHRGHHPSSSSRPGGSFDKFSQLVDLTPCSQYLCPSSLDCVPNPSECPCPFVEDIKCPITVPSSSSSSTKFSDSFICTRAPGCSKVQMALKFGSK